MLSFSIRSSWRHQISREPCTSYLTKMFVQQRLVELGWPTALLFLPLLLSGLASMLGIEIARRIHPQSLRRFYAVCALLCGTGCMLVGAAPALAAIFGCMLVQGILDVWLLHEGQMCIRDRSPRSRHRQQPHRRPVPDRA